MSTLPFLLSVADELDNINSQSYMDDFGLGFHPHRQYYRTPTIQLSLPASTDWMQQERQNRFRSHKFYDETQNNLQSTGEEEEEYVDNPIKEDKYSADMMERFKSEPSTSVASRQKYAISTLNSNVTTPHSGIKPSASSITKMTTDAIAATASSVNKAIVTNTNISSNARRVQGVHDDDDDDNIDNSVRMYNLSKKCCKNYHRHAIETNSKDAGSSCHQAGQSSSACSSTTGGGTGITAGGYGLHSKCMEGNNSSSEESLQKVSSSIEFLTCFLLKRSRASSSSRNATGSGTAGSSNKKS